MNFASRFSSLGPVGPFLRRRPQPCAVGLDLNEQGLFGVVLQRHVRHGWALHAHFVEPLAPGCLLEGQVLDLPAVEAALSRLGERMQSLLADPAHGAAPGIRLWSRSRPGGVRVALAMPSQLVVQQQAGLPATLSQPEVEDRLLALMAEQMRCTPESLCVDFRPASASELSQVGQSTVAWHVAAAPQEALEDRMALLEATGLPWQWVTMPASDEAAAWADAGPQQQEGAAYRVAYGLALMALPPLRVSRIARPSRLSRMASMARILRLSRASRSTPLPGSPPHFDFLPYRAKAALQQKKSFALQAAAVIASALLLIALLRVDLLAQQSAQRAAHAALKHQLKQLDLEATARAKRLSELAASQERWAQLALDLQGRQHTPHLLRELASLIPEGLYLNRLSLGAQGYDMAGQARSAEEVFALLGRLTADSTYLRQASLQDLSLLPGNARGEGHVEGMRAGASAPPVPARGVHFSLQALSP